MQVTSKFLGGCGNAVSHFVAEKECYASMLGGLHLMEGVLASFKSRRGCSDDEKEALAAVLHKFSGLEIPLEKFREPMHKFTQAALAMNLLAE